MMDEAGVIVGANETYAWLLPWWWKHYSRHNTLPVTFVDFGLSQEALAWCREKGKVLCLNTPAVDQIDPVLAEKWESEHGKQVWSARRCFFQKPPAFQSSPYKLSLWLDVDCEVCGSVQPFFDFLDKSSELALSVFPDRPETYSSGAVVFRRDSQLLKEWAELCHMHSSQVLEEDSILSWLIQTGKYAVQVLPPSYHSIGLMDLKTSGLVLHWNGNLGKLFIEMHGGYQEYRESLLRGAHG